MHCQQCQILSLLFQDRSQPRLPPAVSAFTELFSATAPSESTFVRPLYYLSVVVGIAAFFVCFITDRVFFLSPANFTIAILLSGLPVAIASMKPLTADLRAVIFVLLLKNCTRPGVVSSAEVLGVYFISLQNDQRTTYSRRCKFLHLSTSLLQCSVHLHP